MTPIRWIAQCCLVFSLTACHQSVLISPSLSPVDIGRRRATQPRTSVSACTSYLLHAIPTGGKPLREATETLRSKKGVDGFVEVTAEESTIFWILGHTACTTVSARPFVYERPRRKSRSQATSLPRKTPKGPKPTPVLDCGLVCERFGRITATQGVLQQRATKRCKSRCPSDLGYHQCATRASSPMAAARCEAMAKTPRR